MEIAEGCLFPLTIESFNKTIDHWINEIRFFTLKQLLAKPDRDSWSLGQVYKHLLEESEWYNEQSAICLATSDHWDKEMSEDAKRIFRANAFDDVRIKGDPFISEHVKQPISRAQLLRDLQKLRADTNVLWDKIICAEPIGKSQHPGLGYFSAKEWLQYSGMHLRHHLRQKERITIANKRMDKKELKERVDNVGDYLAKFSPEVRSILEKLANTIKEAAPGAEEVISYQMPTYRYHGTLVHFAAYKNHIGFYATPTGHKEFEKDLALYKQGKGSVQFPIDKPLPLPLITKIVKFRVKENLAKSQKKSDKNLI